MNRDVKISTIPINTEATSAFVIAPLATRESKPVTS